MSLQFVRLIIFSLEMAVIKTKLMMFLELAIQHIKQSNPWTDPEGSRRLRLPDFQAIGT